MRKKAMYRLLGVVAFCSIIILGLCACTNHNKSNGEKKIASTSFVEAWLVRSYSLSDLKAEADLIIYGEVIDYECSLPDYPMIKTVEYIKIEECIYGDIKPGDIVKVGRMGGHVLLQEHLDACPEERREKIRNELLEIYSQEQLDSEYVEQLVRGDTEIKTGKKSVFYLTVDDYDNDEYERLGGYSGGVCRT